jgi:glyoxylase-like metal-dependent hydrolase (beta-lactamase superfamily II)
MFHTGRQRVKRTMLEASVPREEVWLPILCFIIEHSERGPILIDAGFGTTMLGRRSAWWGRLLAKAGKMTFEEGMDCRSRIQQCGFEPAEVSTALLTHMHLDHTGAILELADTTFHVSRRELEFARGQRGISGLMKGYVAGDYRSADNLEPYDWGPADDLEPFDTSFDLLGDGTVLSIPTPGHSPGHASILVRMADGKEALLTGDAAFTTQHVEADVGLGTMPRRFAWDLHGAEHTLFQLRALVKRRTDVMVLTSHDPEQGDDVSQGPQKIVEV